MGLKIDNEPDDDLRFFVGLKNALPAAVVLWAIIYGAFWLILR